MKRNFKSIFAVSLLLAVLVSALPVSAASSFTSYTYWDGIGDERKEVYNKSMYTVETVLDADALNVPEFKGLNAVYTDSDEKIYLLDSDSHIYVFDSDYQYLYQLDDIDGETYNDAKSIYVHSDGTVYICDTEGRRILHATADGHLMNVIYLPDSQLIPDDFDFRPLRIVIDNKGCQYILSEGSYYGALLYDATGTFLGFFGANEVNSGIGDVISNIFSRMFPNNVKKANSASKVPYSFVDIKADADGFIYTCNGKTEQYDNSGQIRKLSPGTGKNILDSEEVDFTDTPVNSEYSFGAFSTQDIMGIAVDSDGFIYALESVYGKVLLYDSDCRMITAFGGGMHEGTQEGTFVNVSSIALLDNGNRVLITDNSNNDLTVFRVNEYGKEVKRLDKLTIDGKYSEVKEGWEKLIKEDASLQIAYSGMASVCIEEKDYAEAMRYAKLGYDRDTYGVAFEYQRSQIINDNFTLIFAVILLLLAAFFAFIIVTKKRKVTFVKNRELKCLFQMLIRPSDSFELVKYKGYGSIAICVVLVLLYYVSVVMQTLCGGFLFTVYDPDNFNSLFVFARSAGLIVLWIVANWLVTTLLGGKGKLREIIVVTCYSLLPMIVMNFIVIVATNVLLTTEAGFIPVLNVIAILYFLILMISGLLKIHDFSFKRLVGTSALSLVGVAIMVFLIIMLVILFQQTAGFVATVISELRLL